MATLDELAKRLMEFRSKETLARGYRIALEDEIARSAGVGENELKCLVTESGLKLRIETGFEYVLAKGFDAEVVPHRKAVKFEVDIDGYERLKEIDPEAYRLARKFVTRTKKNASVEIE